MLEVCEFKHIQSLVKKWLFLVFVCDGFPNKRDKNHYKAGRMN